MPTIFENRTAITALVAMFLLSIPPCFASSGLATSAPRFGEIDEQNLPYSKEAVEAGLEGTAMVLLLLDRNGKVIAARIEESSGHALLDRDALKAARRLIFPKDAPREILYPIRFRLRNAEDE